LQTSKTASSIAPTQMQVTQTVCEIWGWFEMPSTRLGSKNLFTPNLKAVSKWTIRGISYRPKNKPTTSFTLLVGNER